MRKGESVMASSQDQSSVDYDFERAERFYSKLRARIVAWLNARTNVDGQVREYLLLLPDLFALITRLIADPRIDASLKVQLIAVSAYVISPIDLVPDFLLPVGLLDDIVAIAFVLSRVVRLMEEAGEDILREHWEGEGDVLAQVQSVAGTADGMLNKIILRRLRRLFPKGRQ
jgi:uncharacterized membrane protein YkvA (DUF1232 family)